MQPNEIELLLSTLTANYDSTEGAFWPYQLNSRVPLFHTGWVPRMLTDQRIQLALRMIKGPILSASRFFIRDEAAPEATKPTPLKQFLIKNIDRFWRYSAMKALRAIEWGFSGNECLFKLHDNQIHFDSLKIVHARDARVIIKDGQKVGISVKRVPGHNGKLYLGGPKGLWHIHQREESPWYGLSRLFGAFQPWFEMHTDGGAKDIRKLYYRKYAFSGEVMYYPVGDSPTPRDPTNTETMSGSEQYSNKWIAQQLLEKRRTGGTMALPGTYYENGQRKWELSPAATGPGATDILEYHSMMKAEMFEGMGVPNEIVEAAEVGSGWSGRAVPQDAFFATLQEIVNWLIFDFDQQVLRELVRLNFGSDQDYEIIPFGLLRGPENIESTEKQTRAGAYVSNSPAQNAKQQLEMSFAC